MRTGVSPAAGAGLQAVTPELPPSHPRSLPPTPACGPGEQQSCRLFPELPVPPAPRAGLDTVWQAAPWVPLTSMSPVSSRNRLLTDTSASSGHSWNQSMAVQFTTAGNLRARTRRVEPTGEKQRMTWARASHITAQGNHGVCVCLQTGFGGGKQEH